MEKIFVGICLVIFVELVHGQCDINNCLLTEMNPLFATCSEYIQTLDCMRGQYDACTGQAGRAEIMLSVRALNRPSDCGMDVRNMASSMSARSSLVNSMMGRTPPGALPPGSLSFSLPTNPMFPRLPTNPLFPTLPTNPLFPTLPPNPLFPMPNASALTPPGLGAGMMPMFPMMDDEGEMDMEMPEPGEGMSEMWEDMMESGMMMPGMMLPGMLPPGAAGAQGFPPMQNPSPGIMSPGTGRVPTKSKFVYYGNTAPSSKLPVIQMIWTTLAVLFLSVL